MVPEPLCISGGYEAQPDTRLDRPDLSLLTLETWKPLISTRAYFAFRAAIASHVRNNGAAACRCNDCRSLCPGSDRVEVVCRPPQETVPTRTARTC